MLNQVITVRRKAVVKLPVVVSRPDKSVLCLSYLWNLELSGGLYIYFQDKARYW
jgi:hypothetical protein